VLGTVSALGGEKCDKVVTDENEEMGRVSLWYFSVVFRCWSVYFFDGNMRPLNQYYVYSVRLSVAWSF